MVSVIYVVLSAFILCWLALHVIKHRRKSRISLGDGDNKDLRAAIAAHSNATENIPIALLLLVILEYNGGNIWMVHFLGVSLVVGRLLHARGLLTSKFKGRVLGMQITVLMILGVAIANIVYLPYDKLLAL